MLTVPHKHRILIADDEPDISTVTRMSLKGLHYHGRPATFVTVQSGQEAVEMMRAYPDTSLILMDVVMETPTAGLDACHAIRHELGNRFVRILLRTGQPGVAPERETIDEYEIDGYLPKSELTSNRLYAAVRTALKSYEELIELEQYRQRLTLIHDAMIGLHTFEPLEEVLERILATAFKLAPTSLAVLWLQTFGIQGDPRRYFLHVASVGDIAEAQAAAEAIAKRINTDVTFSQWRTAGAFAPGCLVSLALHRELGAGWIYLEDVECDEATREALTILAGHAANALYATVAQALLTESPLEVLKPHLPG